MLPQFLELVRQSVSQLTAEQMTTLRPPRGSTPRSGAVLLAIAGTSLADAEVMLTQRAFQMRSHPGQVSFPGGAIDPGEDEVSAALREANEETGLKPDSVTVYGQLPKLWLPPSNFLVTPVLGWWHTPHPLSIGSPHEVHQIYQEPLGELLNPRHRFSVRGPSGWVGPAFWIGHTKQQLLWGFTAVILSKLFEHVGWAQPWNQHDVRELSDDLTLQRRVAW
jgi:8-oxo-dGTP pyrophosphatase MutT (NUDIX family)